MNARVVAATEEDLPAIAQLAACIWRAYYPGIISVEQIEYMLARMYSTETLRDDVRIRGIRYDRLLAADELVGFVAYGALEPPQAGAADGVTIKLHKLYVHPKWHGHGLGSYLLQHCEREARNAGASRLILSVNKRNSKALAAYQRNGFTVARSVIEDIGGGFVMDDFVMEKGVAHAER